MKYRSLDFLIQHTITSRRWEVDFTTGEVFSFVKRGFFGQKVKLKPNYVKGYEKLTLSALGEKASVFVHRIVWVAANGMVPEGFSVDHINQNKLDNRLINLRLATPKLQANNRAHPKHISVSYATKQQIIHDYSTGEYSHSYLSKKYKVSKSHIGNIVRANKSCHVR